VPVVYRPRPPISTAPPAEFRTALACFAARRYSPAAARRCSHGL